MPVSSRTFRGGRKEARARWRPSQVSVEESERHLAMSSIFGEEHVFSGPVRGKGPGNHVHWVATLPTLRASPRHDPSPQRQAGALGEMAHCRFGQRTCRIFSNQEAGGPGHCSAGSEDTGPRPQSRRQSVAGKDGTVPRCVVRRKGAAHRNRSVSPRVHGDPQSPPER